MKTTLTKNERNKIYKEMLAYTHSTICTSYKYGFCYSLCRALDHSETLRQITTNNMFSYPLMQHLSELIKHKPTSFYNHIGVETEDDRQFWFNMGNKEVRIKILEQAIKETT